MYQTVIFDMDGTLLDTLEDLRDGVNYAMRKKGYPERTPEEIRAFVGNGIHRLIERAVPQGLSCEKLEEVFEEFREYYTAHCQIKTRPYDGITEVMQVLKKKGVGLAIVSNKNDAAVKELAGEYFGDYVERKAAIGEREGIGRKPAPDSVFEAMHLLGAERETTVYVGDSEVDRETAENAGIACVSVTWGFRDEDFLRSLHPEYLIRKPEELLSIFL